MMEGDKTLNLALVEKFSDFLANHCQSAKEPNRVAAHVAALHLRAYVDACATHQAALSEAEAATLEQARALLQKTAEQSAAPDEKASSAERAAAPIETASSAERAATPSEKASSAEVSEVRKRTVRGATPVAPESASGRAATALNFDKRSEANFYEETLLNSIEDHTARLRTSCHNLQDSIVSDRSTLGSLKAAMASNKELHDEHDSRAKLLQ